MQQLAEQLSQEEIMCDEGVEEEEDDEEIKKLENEKVINKNIFFKLYLKYFCAPGKFNTNTPKSQKTIRNDK